MNGIGARMARWGTLALAAVASLSAGSSAEAAPPPPNFWNFTVSNSTGQDVQNVVILLYAHAAGRPDVINTTDPVRLEVSRLASGTTVKLGLPVVYGIARIQATGQCPSPSTANVTITAERRDFVPGGALEYAGFNPESPTSPAEGYAPRLEFYQQAGAPRAKLSAKSRWDDWYDAQPKTHDQPFQ